MAARGRFQWVVAIEGYAYLLTSGPTARAIAAWSATSWSTALGGLKVQLSTEQRIDPWSTSLNPGECVLTIVPDAADTFGADVQQGGGGVETYLRTAIDCNDMTVISTNAGAFAASGSIYIGLERLVYSGKGATDFTISKRGAWSPFSIDGGVDEVGRAHPLPTIDWDVSQEPIISSIPRSWIGKWVGVWRHVVGPTGALDIKSDAQCVFAGTVEAIGDTSDGATIIQCVDVKQRLLSTTLLHDQWAGHATSGIELVAGVRFGMQAVTGVTWTTAADLVVGVGIAAGRYTAEELCVELAAWLNADGTLTGAWQCWIEGDSRFTITWDSAAAPAGLRFTASRYILDTLGFLQPDWIGYDTVSTGYVASATVNLVSPAPVAAEYNFAGNGATLTLGGSQGTWVNNLAWLPPEIYDLTDGAGSWGIVQYGGQLILGKYSSATEFTDTVLLTGLGALISGRTEGFVIREGEGEAATDVRQIVILHGSLATVITHLFASTGTAGYNHASYDSLPAQLGAAIPWDLLGDSFVATLDRLGQSTSTGALTLILEQPTPLWKAIGADMQLRAAYLVWKSGGLQWATLAIPSAWAYDHVWDDDDKASAEPADNQRTISQMTTDHLRNVIVLKYNRAALTAADQYNATVTARFTRSIQEHGEAPRVEISCRNSYAAYAGTGAAVEELAADLIANVLPLFGRPLQIMTRPISPDYYEDVAPGDIVLVSDPHARNPLTGARGITSKPGFILAHRRSFGGNGEQAFGEAEVLFLDQDRTAVYCPTAEVESYAASVFTCTLHAHSEASGTADAQEFADGDAILVIEIDPAAPGSPATHLTTVSGTPTSTDITVTDAFGGYDAAKKYRIISQTYASAVATQQADCYLADNADGLISDVAAPYHYGLVAGTSYTVAAATQLAERHSTINITEGGALATGPAAAMARNINNAIGYATAPHGPLMLETLAAVQAETWVLVQCVPVFLGKGTLPAGQRRMLTIAPMCLTTNAANTTSVRVTVSRRPPEGGTGIGVVHRTPHVHLTFTTTSTSPTMPAAQTCQPFILQSTGLTWVTVEVTCSDDMYIAGYFGLPKFWLGPLEAI